MPDDRTSSLLACCVSQTQPLAGLVEYAADSVVSKRLIDKKTGTVTLFAFDVGQRLSTHQAPYDALVQVVEGTAAITIGDRALTLPVGHIVIMPANVPHSVHAACRFKMLLTMMRE